VTRDRDSALSRVFGRRSGGGKSPAPLRPGCGLLTEPPCPAIGEAQRMRAQAASDGRACAQAHPDDHGGDSPAGRGWGALGSLPALTGVARHAGERPAPLVPQDVEGAGSRRPTPLRQEPTLLHQSGSLPSSPGKSKGNVRGG
jgi:hypothetical protein